MATSSKPRNNRNVSLKLDDDYIDLRLRIKLPKLRIQWLLALISVVLIWLIPIPHLIEYIKLFLSLVGK